MVVVVVVAVVVVAVAVVDISWGLDWKDEEEEEEEEENDEVNEGELLFNELSVGVVVRVVVTGGMIEGKTGGIKVGSKVSPEVGDNELGGGVETGGGGKDRVN